MTKTLSVNEISTEIVIKSAKSGNEIVLEENGKPIANKITPIVEIEQTQPKQRVLGLGRDNLMSHDFDDELPDEFWGFDKEF